MSMNYIIDKSLLKRLCSQCAPSSREMELQKMLSIEFASIGINCVGDAIGNLYARLNSEAEVQIALVAHADEIGIQITQIDEHGLLRFRKIGGLRCTSLFGHKVRILNGKGHVAGIIGCDPLQDNGTDNGILVKTSDLWIDIGVDTREEAEQMVEIGDFAVFEPDFMLIGNHRAVSKAFDDRLGTYVILQAIRRLQQENIKIGVTAISTVQEELSMRGITACHLPLNAAIVVDVDFATDIPTAHGDMGLLRLGSGVGININADSNPVLQKLFCDVADKEGLAYQKTLSRNLSGGTDATRLQTSGNVATLNINIPLRYMHTHSEMCDMRDVASAVESVVAVIKHIEQENIKEFIPWQNI